MDVKDRWPVSLDDELVDWESSLDATDDVDDRKEGGEADRKLRQTLLSHCRCRGSGNDVR